MQVRLRNFTAMSVLLGAAVVPFEVRALSCEYYPDSLRSANDVYIVTPRQVLSRDLVLEKYSRIGGMPATYDLVRFDVVEVLRGPPLDTLELYCGSGCGDNPQLKLSVFSVAKPRSDGQPNMIAGCNVGPADDGADAQTKQALDDVRNGIRERASR